MRRSAAPSQKQPVSKRPKFSTPYKLIPAPAPASAPAPVSQNLNNNNSNIRQTSDDHKKQNLDLGCSRLNPEQTPCFGDFKRNVNISTPGSPSPRRLAETNLNISNVYNKPTFKPVPGKTALSQSPGNQPVEDRTPKNYFNVVWCKRSNKKHKKWEGDAILVTCGRSVTLYDLEGKEIGKGTGYKVKELETLQEDQTLPIGGREILVMSVLLKEDYLSGKCFSAGGGSSTEPQSTSVQKVKQKPFVDPQKSHVKLIQQNDQNSISGRPRHEPLAEGALVMPRPSPEHQLRNNHQNLPIVDVVVDPYMTSNLRPHQREGVLFLYQCIMGFKDYYGFGAILADDMGLGKTLQCITLLWTLLKQGPYGGKPVIKKALIITPGSLVKNWYAEFKKWLGKERLNVFAVSANQKVQDYKSSNIYPVLIVSYEMFVRTYDTIKGENFDIVICDEGHRLKNTAIKTTSLIMSLGTRKRVVLTGTPVQNDLQEFFSIVEFCNPNILGTSAAFRRVYEDPIVASRQPGASPEIISLGEERGAELSRLTSMFILRRTQEINNRYLPPKVELVLFCKPSQFQLEIYRQFLTSRSIRQCLLGCIDGAPHLICIAALKQLCNHPRLVYDKAIQASGPTDGENVVESVYSGLSPLYPPDYGDRELVCEDSGKLMVLSTILSAVHHPASREKIVVVSNHTKTLNVLERFCGRENYKFVRLDGSTPTNQRQDIVQKFNNKYSAESVFLLSSKAGGVGLNLIGASRLVLYDIDWNPANDLQAMARVWRDGQKKKVYIYRLLTTGTIEEKVYQRQISKQGLSGAVIDLRNKSNVQFSREDLKDLFSLNESTLCDTHTLLNCSCSGNGEDSGPPSVLSTPVQRSCQLGQPKLSDKKNLSMDELHDWKHLVGSHPDLDPAWYLHDLNSYLSYIFYNETQNTPLL